MHFLSTRCYLRFLDHIGERKFCTQEPGSATFEMMIDSSRFIVGQRQDPIKYKHLAIEAGS